MNFDTIFESEPLSALMAMPVKFTSRPSAPVADPTACLTGEQVTRAFIQAVCPDEMVHLMGLYHDTLARYAGAGYGPYLPYVALNAVDTHIRQRHEQRVVIDGVAIGPGDSRLVTGWGTAKCNDGTPIDSTVIENKE